MIFLYSKYFIIGGTIFTVFLMYCAFSAYYINTRRTADDPAKKDFAPLSPWLTPAEPVIWLATTVTLTPLAILFGLFLVLFPFILILFRPLPENDPIKQTILKIGNGILKLNTRLLMSLGLHSKPIRFQVQ